MIGPIIRRNAPRLLRSSIRRAPTAPTPSYLPSIASQSPRLFHASLPRQKRSDAPQEPPPTSFADLDVLANTPAPSTSVDVCMDDGFGLNSGITISNGDGALLLNGEAFLWRPWLARGEKKVVNAKGQFDVPAESLSMLDLLWPRPGTLPMEHIYDP